MQAAFATAYGGPEVVQLRDVPDPVPKANEVLVRIRATTVSSGDARLRGARFPAGFGPIARLIFGLTRPRQPILGTELSGVVESAGSAVTRWRPGDHVFAFAGAGMRCHAELRCLPETGAIAAIPQGFSFEEAAAISFGGTTALYFLRDVARLQPDERVLVNGASGAVGSAAVQLARHFGAHVTGVASAANAELVRSLGAQDVIDYRTTDFATSGERYDVILDTVGNAPFHRARAALRPKGRLLIIAAGLGELLKSPAQSKTSGFKVAGGTAPDRAQDVAELRRLCEAGVYRPVIDSVLPFARIAEAHARADTGHKAGNVVVTMA